ncbi:MAG TPA: hypothetical protein VGK36_02090 [Candidatus Angelobacter sp.]|jgi:hypothetical protein
MLFIKRPGLVGSAAGTLLVATLFLRSGTPVASMPGTDSKQERSAAGQRKEPQTSAPKKNSQADGPWRASRQHFAGIQSENQCPGLQEEPESRSGASPAGVTVALQRTSRSTAAKNERSSIWCIPEGVPVRAMIAIVPDPVHSRMSLLFDRSVEALQLSAESINYVVDRYWLPWQPDPGIQDNSDNEKEPGLLIFRWNGAIDEHKPTVLYVFLVSDTSTAGIDGIQFRHAVQYIQQICGAPGKPTAGCNDGSHIWIMGPTFSGSLASLRALTAPTAPVKKHGAATATPYFTAYSGTVSSICAIHNQGLVDKTFVLDKLSPGCVDKEKSAAEKSSAANAGPTPSPASSPITAPTPTPSLTFKSTVSDSETVLRKFLNALKEKGDIQCGDSTEVAILSEAATAYGSAGSTPTTPDQGDAATPGTKDWAADCSFTSFRYPREISALRNASASSGPPAAATPQTGVVQTPTYLPFTLGDRQANFSDEPPDFSQIQGPLSKEAVLMKFAAELRRGHYKFVGIIGTNVMDVLFLTAFLRAACPDIRPFVINSDLLFERDTSNAPYIGTLSLSSYPLLTSNLDWTSLGHKLPRLPFPDQYEQGQYNASLLVMKGVIPAPGDSFPLEVDEPFTKYESDSKTRDLPVWMTVVGTGGYWPVQLIPPDPVTGVATGVSSLATRLATQDFSPTWRTLALLIVALSFLQSWILCKAKPVSSRFRDFALVSAAPTQRFFFINVVSVSLAFMLATIIVPALKFGMDAGKYVPSIAMLGVIGIIALFVSSLYLGYLLEQIRHEEDNSEFNWSYIWSMLFSAAAWLAAVLAALCWWCLHADSKSQYGFFFGYRTVNLATGVSPLAPMLLLVSAIFLWGIFEILRLRFDDRLRPRLNIAGNFPGGTEGDIARSINGYLLRPNYRVVFCLAFGAWLLSLEPAHPFELFERNTFGCLFEFFFCVVVALMLTSGLRLAQTWTQLRNLLRDLERSPIREAFSSLHDPSWSPIWQSGGQEEEWTNMVHSLEIMHQIKNCDKQVGLAKDINAALAKRDAIRSKVRVKPVDGSIKGFRQVEQLFFELQKLLATVLNDMMRQLDAHWESHSRVASNKPEEEDKLASAARKDETPPEADRWKRMEEYVALRYVAFIRGVLGNIRLWLILQAAVFSLVLLSLNVYSFEPHRSLIWSFTAIFAVIGVVVIQVLMQAHKDDVISRITGTTANKLELQFYVRIAKLGAVPFLTLLATHFPSLGHYLSSLFQPGLDALK